MGRVNLLLLLIMALVMISVDGFATGSNHKLGPPISPAEFAEAMANPLLRLPPPANDHAIEDSGKFEGDMLLTQKQQAEMPKGALRSATSEINKIWVNGVIPYTISDVFTPRERQVIARAMGEFKAKTCLRFVGRTSEQDYINVISDQGCYSFVGRIGGGQPVSLAQGGCIYFGTVIHEFMHAAGFNHEQSRYDRDDYVIINWENVLPGMEVNFYKKDHITSKDLGLPYDFMSIMHYKPDYFSRDPPAPTIVSKGGQQFGFREDWSEHDVKGLNLLYNCEDSGTGTGTGTGTGPGTGPGTGQGPGTGPGTGTGTGEKCEDISLNCAANLFQCKTNGLVANRCKKSCNLCLDKCEDISPNCAANLSQCKTNGWVANRCRKSCNLCQSQNF